MAGLLLTGATGHLGAYVVRAAQDAGRALTAWSGTTGGDLFGMPVRPVELTDVAAVRAAFTAARPDVVLHAAAMANVAHCHARPDEARRVNVGATRTLVDLCAAAGARLVQVSTDLVFDGEAAPYREEDAPQPL